MRIGVDDREWSAADESVARAGRAALAALEKEGAVLVPVNVDLAPHAVSMGAIVIAMETRAGIDEEFRVYGDDFGPDNQIVMSVLEHIGGIEYLNALRLRQGLRRDVAAVLREVDVLAMPTTATTATAVTDAQMISSFLDAKAIREALPLHVPGQPHGAAGGELSRGPRRERAAHRPADRRRRLRRRRACWPWRRTSSARASPLRAAADHGTQSSLGSYMMVRSEAQRRRPSSATQGIGTHFISW